MYAESAAYDGRLSRSASARQRRGDGSGVKAKRTMSKKPLASLSPRSLRTCFHRVVEAGNGMAQESRRGAKVVFAYYWRDAAGSYPYQL